MPSNAIHLSSLLIVAVLLGGCMDHMHDRSYGPITKQDFSSEGERLYFLGVSSSGEIIRPIGGHHHMRMHGGSCVTCHGHDKKGGMTMWPYFWIKAPDISEQGLSKDHGDGHQHAQYDSKSLEVALREGLNPEGKPLDDTMPLWEMSDASMHALIDYLLPDNHTHSH